MRPAESAQEGDQFVQGLAGDVGLGHQLTPRAAFPRRHPLRQQRPRAVGQKTQESALTGGQRLLPLTAQRLAGQWVP
jgi:hypothetical protein